MLKLSDRLTVPQVFFNENHLGGANDIFKLKDDGELLNLYNKLVVNQETTTLPELERPTEAVRTNSAKVEKLKEPPLCMGGTCQSYGSLIKSLIRPIDNNDVKKGQLYLDIRDRKTQYFTYN